LKLIEIRQQRYLGLLLLSILKRNARTHVSITLEKQTWQSFSYSTRLNIDSSGTIISISYVLHLKENQSRHQILLQVILL